MKKILLSLVAVLSLASSAQADGFLWRRPVYVVPTPVPYYYPYGYYVRPYYPYPYYNPPVFLDYRQVYQVPGFYY